MRKTIKPEERCEKCDHLTKSKEEDIFCDNCEIKLDKHDDYRGYPFSISTVGCVDHAMLEYCSTKCAFEWVSKNGERYLEVNGDEYDHAFFSLYLFPNDVKYVKHLINPKIGGYTEAKVKAFRNED